MNLKSRTCIATLLICSAPFAAADYCDSKGSNTNYEWIDSVSVNDTAYDSGNNGGYFSHDSSIITLSPDETHTISLAPEFRYGSYTEYWNVWIDFNQDDVFSSEEIVFSGVDNEQIHGEFTLPEGVQPGFTAMRVTMQYGAEPESCGSFYYGETEDFVVEIPDARFPYGLSIDNDWSLYRSGEIGDSVTWVIEMDGEVVLRRNASNELSYQYYRNYPTSSYRVWLESYIDGAYQQVSEIISYGEEPIFYELSVDSDYTITRSGELGDSAQWVIEKDGNIVLQRNASNELQYQYYSNTDGSAIRVWLQSFVDGEYEVISNIVSYTVSHYDYDLTIDSTYTLHRSGELGDSMSWVVIKNGNVVLQRNAANELSYKYYSNTPGSTIEVYLQAWAGSSYEQISESVIYYP